MSVQDIKCWTLWWSFIPKADKMLKMEASQKTNCGERRFCLFLRKWSHWPHWGRSLSKTKQNSQDKCVSPQRSRAISSYPPQNICSQPLRNKSTLHPNRFACLHIQAHTFKSNKLTPWVFKLTVGHDIWLGWSDVVLASYGSAVTYVDLIDTENVSSLSFQTYHY